MFPVTPCAIVRVKNDVYPRRPGVFASETHPHLDKTTRRNLLALNYQIQAKSNDPVLGITISWISLLLKQIQNKNKIQSRFSRFNILITNAVSFERFHGHLTLLPKGKGCDPVSRCFLPPRVLAWSPQPFSTCLKWERLKQP